MVSIDTKNAMLLTRIVRKIIRMNRIDKIVMGIDKIGFLIVRIVTRIVMIVTGMMMISFLSFATKQTIVE